ncbi:MAG: hypothetical protein ABIP35_10575 [Ginsengibacter sp.]
MENIYTAYTREINNQTFYFVKKFTSFPEVNDGLQFMDSFAMHHDFFKACSIAKIANENVIENLMNQLNITTEDAKIIPLHKKSSFNHSILRNTHQAFLRLRLAGLNS